MSKKQEVFIAKQNFARLDLAVARSLDLTRSEATSRIRKNLVRLNKNICKKPSQDVLAGDEICVFEPTDEDFSLDFKVEVLYENEDMLVVNKPRNLVVHPAKSHKGASLVHWLKHNGYSLSTIDQTRPGIVHRLDKNTTGALIVAKNNSFHEKITQEFKSQTVERYYLAIINQPLKDDIVLEKPIARSKTNPTKLTTSDSGKYAKTMFVKLARATNTPYELIGARLFTGRTHQIRVHLGYLGRFVLGDTHYAKKNSPHEMMLHALCVVSRELPLIKAPLNQAFKTFLQKYFNKDEINETINSEHFLHRFDIGA